MRRVCFAVGCDICLERKGFFCARHWGKIPIQYRMVVWSFWPLSKKWSKNERLASRVLLRGIVLDLFQFETGSNINGLTEASQWWVREKQAGRDPRARGKKGALSVRANH